VKIPASQSRGMDRGGWTSFPEGPCRIHYVEMLWSFAEAEDREGGAEVAADLGPVAGVDHELSVGEEWEDLQEEVFDASAAELEHAVGGPEQLVVDNLVFGHSRNESGGGDLGCCYFITEWFEITVNHKLVANTIRLFTLDEVFE